MYNDDLVNDTYKVIESSRRQKSQTFLLNQENYSYILKNNKKFQSTYKTIQLYIKQISILDAIYPHLTHTLRQKIYFVSNQMVKHLQQQQQQAFIIKNLVFCVACYLLSQSGLIGNKQRFLTLSNIKYRYFIKHKHQISLFCQPAPSSPITTHHSLLRVFCQMIQ